MPNCLFPCVGVVSAFIVRTPLVYWSSEFETPRIRRHCLTAVTTSGPGVQFRPPARSMVPYFEDEGALLPARKPPQIRTKHVFMHIGAVQREADVFGLPGSQRQE